MPEMFRYQHEQSSREAYEGYQEKFLSRCALQELDRTSALADSGASINLLPYSIYKKLGLEALTPLFLSPMKTSDNFEISADELAPLVRTTGLMMIQLLKNLHEENCMDISKNTSENSQNGVHKARTRRDLIRREQKEAKELKPKPESQRPQSNPVNIVNNSNPLQDKTSQ
ncbi:reverse transcriptase domain-containing protein [Tanacetum coccineum]